MMTEYLPFIIIIVVAVVAIIITQVHGGMTNSEDSQEPFKYSMSLEATKAELDQILCEAINCNGIERYWGPSQTVTLENGFIALRYKINFEYTSSPDSFGESKQILTHMILTANLKEADGGTSLAHFIFEDEQKAVFGQSPESSFLKKSTMERITQRLAQLSIQSQRNN